MPDTQSEELFLSADQLHLGLTTRCNLVCPFCARTQEKNRWFGSHNVDLDFASYKKFFDELDIETLLLCGNYGDPIFYPELFELIQYMKDRDVKIKIHTNGTGHNNEWWDRLTKMLKWEDRIFFSIDGLEHNFTTYRKNASWFKIMEHINTIIKNKDRPRLIWKYILFKYNENNVLEAMDLCKKIGMDSFYLTDPFFPDHEEQEWKPSYTATNYPLPYEVVKMYESNAVYVMYKT